MVAAGGEVALPSLGTPLSFSVLYQIKLFHHQVDLAHYSDLQILFDLFEPLCQTPFLENRYALHDCRPLGGQWLLGGVPLDAVEEMDTWVHKHKEQGFTLIDTGELAIGDIFDLVNCFLEIMDSVVGSISGIGALDIDQVDNLIVAELFKLISIVARGRVEYKELIQAGFLQVI